MFRIVSASATRLHQGRCNGGTSRLYKTMHRYYSKEQQQPQQKSELCPPPPPKKPNTGTGLTIGALALVGGAIICYAKYDPDFRCYLTEYVPFTDGIIKFIFQEDKSYYESFMDTIDDLRSGASSAEGGASEGGRKAKKAIKEVPKDYQPPSPLFPSIAKDAKDPEVKYDEIRLESKDKRLPEPTIEIVDPKPLDIPLPDVHPRNLVDIETRINIAASEAVMAYNSAVYALRNYMQDVETIVESSVDRVDPSIWNSLKQKSKAKEDAIALADSQASVATENLKKLRDLLHKGDIAMMEEDCTCKLKDQNVTAAEKMRFVQFQLKSGGPQHVGAQLAVEGDIIDISGVDSSIPNTLLKCLRQGNGLIEKAKRIVAEGKSLVPLADVTLLPPITHPDKVACVGLNYSGHCDEQNIPYPKEPMVFSKFASTIIGPYDTIKLPKVSNSVDWEVELAIVIGKQAKNIRQDQAQDHIFGYTIAQDISARDWQKLRNGGQFLLGKSMDTFCPIGPAIVTKNKLNAQNLNIKSYVNGQLKQNGNTDEMIFKIDFLVAYLSEFMTLYPGDLILTGTPSGVGMHRKPAEFLKPGDVVESEIEGIGKMVNTVE